MSGCIKVSDEYDESVGTIQQECKRNIMKVSKKEFESIEGVPWRVPECMKASEKYDGIVERILRVLETMSVGGGVGVYEGKAERNRKLLRS